ncbi:hypothetical protein JKF63_04810 [Porcisia hertigi]|uniref:Uncharacterized protein n=1 Tax=Porcisia hertigi TaxID=2761500 RepID=A0A836I495_9TRYP|nr:hypothetical protein JKF63_04810 [Porcisia hertigi]
MSWVQEKGHQSQRSRTAEPPMTNSVVPLTQSSHSYTFAATQQLQPKEHTILTSGAAICPAIATVARQKARYARFSYAPPPALRRSHLHLSTTVNTSDTLGGTQHSDEARRVVGPLVQQSQPSQYDTEDSRTAAGAGSTTRTAGRWNPALHPLPPLPPSLPHQRGSPPFEWCQTLVALQERQLLCWQQLTETQQLLTHHVERLREDLGHVHAFLMNRLGKHSRLDGDRHSEASTAGKPAPAAPNAIAETSQQNVSAHMVRLLGESATSTPAPVQDAPVCRDPAQVAEWARISPLKPPAEAKKVSSDGGGAALSQSTTDAADSEADIFML